MTLIDITTGEVTHMSAASARESVERARTHLESAADELVRQINGRAWLALGYTSWDEMREAEYRGAVLIVPRADRPELVARLRREGLSQKQIGDTLGVSDRRIRDDLAEVTGESPDTKPETRTDSLGRERPTSYAPQPWSDEEQDLLNRLQSGETIVATLRGPHNRLIEWAEQTGLYVRVDRRTEWGNPFATPEDGNRETVINNYERYYLPHKPSLIAKLPSLRGKVLGCWCAPEPCHGDVLKTRADE